MFDIFKNAFTGSQGPEAGDSREKDIRIATCALFLEIANIDDEFSDEERENILRLLQTEFDMSQESALELARQAAAELEGSIDLWQFTNLINENYSEPEKLRVAELLWGVVYADGKLDAHEDYLIHKLGTLLRLTPKQLIAAKLKVLHGG